MLGLKAKLKNRNSLSAISIATNSDSLCVSSRLKSNDNAYRIKNYQEYSCPGLMTNKTLFQSVLKEAVPDKKIPIHLILNPNDYQLLVTKKPYADDENYSDTLKAQLHNKIKFPPEESCLLSVPCLYSNLYSQEEQCFVCVAHMPRLLSIQNVFKKSKLNLQSISVSELSLSNWISRILQYDRKSDGFLLYPVANAMRLLLIIDQQLGAFSFLPNFSEEIINEEQKSLFILSLQQQITHCVQLFSQRNVQELPVYVFDENIHLVNLLKNELNNRIQLLNVNSIFNLKSKQNIILDRALPSLSGAVFDG